eukprot:403354929
MRTRLSEVIEKVSFDIAKQIDIIQSLKPSRQSDKHVNQGNSNSSKQKLQIKLRKWVDPLQSLKTIVSEVKNESIEEFNDTQHSSFRNQSGQNISLDLPSQLTSLDQQNSNQQIINQSSNQKQNQSEQLAQLKSILKGKRSLQTNDLTYLNQSSARQIDSSINLRKLPKIQSYNSVYLNQNESNQRVDIPVNKSLIIQKESKNQRNFQTHMFNLSNTNQFLGHDLKERKSYNSETNKYEFKDARLNSNRSQINSVIRVQNLSDSDDSSFVSKQQQELESLYQISPLNAPTNKQYYNKKTASVVDQILKQYGNQPNQTLNTKKN